MAPLRAALAAATVAVSLAPAVASAEPIIRPVCQMQWERPTIGYDENGVPRTVTVERPTWVC